MVAAIAASMGSSQLCPGTTSTSTENLVFMMNMHGFMNDAQFLEEVKATIVDQMKILGEHPEIKEATCAYAKLVNTYANNLHTSAEKILRERRQ